jgi:hypothetical protein
LEWRPRPTPGCSATQEEEEVPPNNTNTYAYVLLVNNGQQYCAYQRYILNQTNILFITRRITNRTLMSADPNAIFRQFNLLQFPPHIYIGFH